MVSDPNVKALVVHYVVSKEFVIDVMMTNVTGIEMMMSGTSSPFRFHRNSREANRRAIRR
jgi:hypothetical protein